MLEVRRDRRRRVRHHHLAVAPATGLGTRLGDRARSAPHRRPLLPPVLGVSRFGSGPSVTAQARRFIAAIRPPSTRTSQPDTNAARSEQRNSIVLAMSSVRPGRMVSPTAVAADRCHRGQLHLDRVVLQLESPHRGVDQAGRERHDPPAALAPHDRGPFAQPDHAALREAVRRTGVGLVARERLEARFEVGRERIVEHGVHRRVERAHVARDATRGTRPRCPARRCGRKASSSRATAARSTRRISRQPAIDGERPAVCTSECRSPSAAACRASSSDEIGFGEVAGRRADRSRATSRSTRSAASPSRPSSTSVSSTHVDRGRERERAGRAHRAGRAGHDRDAAQRRASGLELRREPRPRSRSPIAARSRRRRGCASSACRVAGPRRQREARVRDAPLAGRGMRRPVQRARHVHGEVAAIGAQRHAREVERRGRPGPGRCSPGASPRPRRARRGPRRPASGRCPTVRPEQNIEWPPRSQSLCHGRQASPSTEPTRFNSPSAVTSAKCSPNGSPGR